MESATVIRRPLVTEKNTAATEQNRYAFEVDRRATKPDIKRAVEDLYKVRVVSVNTSNRIGKLRRTRFGYTRTPDLRKAVVRVHPDDRIELF